MIIYFLYFTIFICLVFSFFNLKVNNTKTNYVMFLLIFTTFIGELSALYFTKKFNFNNGIYNIILFLTFECWIYFFYCINNKMKLFNIILGVLFLIFNILSNHFSVFNKKLDTNSFIFSAFIFCILLIHFFFKVLKKEDNKSLLMSVLLFHGPLVYYCGFSILFSFFPLGVKYSKVIFDKNLYQVVSYIVNVYYYLSLCIFFIYSIKTKQTLTSE